MNTHCDLLGLPLTRNPDGSFQHGAAITPHAVISLPSVDACGASSGWNVMLMRACQKKAVNFIAIDYPGRGAHEPSQRDIFQSSLLTTVEKGLAPGRPFYLVAESFSAPIALAIAARNKDLTALVLRGPWCFGPGGLSATGAPLPDPAPLDTRANCAAITCPVMVFSASNDQISPPSENREILRLIPNRNLRILVSDHTFCGYERRMAEDTVAFFNRARE